MLLPARQEGRIAAAADADRARLEHELRTGLYALAPGAMPAIDWDWALQIRLPESLTRLSAAWQTWARETIVPGSVYPTWVSDRAGEKGQPETLLQLMVLPLRGGTPEACGAIGPCMKDAKARR